MDVKCKDIHYSIGEKKNPKWSLPKGRRWAIPDHIRTKWEWEINLAQNHLPPVETR